MQPVAGQPQQRCMLVLERQRRKLVRMSCRILVLALEALRSSFLLPDCQAPAR
jgi:hypothetical protein